MACVETAKIENIEMDYIRFGKGDKNFIILPGLSIHSVMGLAELIENAYSIFSEDYTVYVFDRAKDIREGYGVRDMADDTAAVMEALHIKEANIFGASQGGMIALELAIHHGHLVDRMVLGSTLAKANDSICQVIDEWIYLAEKKEEKALLESFADRVYSEATLKAYKDVIISSNQGISEEEYKRFIILAQACKNFDCSKELPNIQSQVLVIGAEGDRVTTPNGCKEIAESLNCDLYLYDASYGHGVYDEAKDYIERCKNFFEK